MRVIREARHALNRIRHEAQQRNAIVCKAVAGLVAASLMLTCAVPSAYARNLGGITIASDSGVTALSGNASANDDTIVAAAQSVRDRRAAARNGSATAIDSFSDDETAFSTTTILDRQSDGTALADDLSTLTSDSETTAPADGATDDSGDADGTGDAGSRAEGDTASGDGQGDQTGQTDGADNDGDTTETTDGTTSDQPQTRVASTTLGGRDFIGQPTVAINGKTYILIGNEQQLRAIGTGAKVVRPIWKVTTAECRQTGTVLGIPTYGWVDIDEVKTQVYAGDADLDANTTLRNQDTDSDHDGALLPCAVSSNVGDTKYHFTTLDDQGNEVSAKAATGQTYSSTANYIVFRDIDLSSNAADQSNTNWTPLMFSGTMLGAMSQSPDTAATLWNGISGAGDAVTDQAVRPTIANVTVKQTGKINQQKQSGIGFFATISNQISLDNSAGGLKSLGETVVSNIRLDNVDVSNESTETEDTVTLVSALTDLLGFVLGTVIGGLVDALGKILGLNLGLKDLLTGLLDVRANDPSLFATGAFAGRVDGEVTVSKCEVSNVSVSNVKGMTGGFVGYSTGETQYEIVSAALGTIIDLLGYILDYIPGIGLGDLVTWLLNGKILAVGSLIPIGYYNPTFSENTVKDFRQNTVIGSDEQDYAGGFIGNQIGTIIENSSVSSANAYTVKARYYAGGFSGVARNGTMEGALNNLGVDLIKVAQPQSLIEGASVSADVTVAAGSYAGGFAGAMANSFAVNDTLDGTYDVSASGVTVTSSGDKEEVKALAGGFTGAATLGWVTDLGSQDAGDTNLLKSVNKILVEALTNGEDATALLSLVGIDPSAILGVSMAGTLTVHSDDDYAGGVVGRGDGAIVAASDSQHLDDFSFWKSGRRTAPIARDNIVTGLKSVTSKGSYAGGIAGQLGTASIGGVVNDTVGLGGYLPFEVSALTVNGVADDGYTVKATGDYASGGIGKATGGYIGKATTAYKTKDADGNDTNDVPETAGVTLNNVKSVEANNHAGGFMGVSGPGDLVGSDGLNLLGLNLLKLSGLLSVAEGVMVQAETVNVNGVKTGMTVTATGQSATVKQYIAGGFAGQANSTQMTDAHVTNLLSVTADERAGNAGGFVGLSTTGGLADVADETSIMNILKGGSDTGVIQIDHLVTAVAYMIPKYTDADVHYVNGGKVSANIAGGFAGDFQSGKVDDTALADESGNAWAVINLDTVAGGAYAGGFGGKVHSGALADAGKGLSILGGLSLNITAAQLASVASLYVPVITSAGVHTDETTIEKESCRQITDEDNPGLTVSASRVDSTDEHSGAAGGYIGYGSGVQVSKSNVTQLRHTNVKVPKDLETTGSISDTYLNSAKSSYAVAGAQYAGGYIGNMGLGSAASVGGGLKVLGSTLTLTNISDVLSVVVSTIEHSDVTGGIGGYSVLSSDVSDVADPLGMAGGFAGYIKGGHIQDSSSHEFAYIIGQVSAGGYAGTMEPGAVADVLGDGSVLDRFKAVQIDNLASLVQDFVPTIRNSSTDAVICGGAVRAQATSDTTTRRGMAGGYAGRNRGGHIWGNNTSAWKNENTDGAYNGTTRVAYAARIRSVYGQEIAGGYTGLMEAADTTSAGSLSLLGGLIQAGNIAGALSVVYPTEEHTKVTGPLRNASFDQWQTWVENTGKYGAYGKDFTEVVKDANNKIKDQETLNQYLNDYVFGFNVVAGRGEFELGANLRDSGVAGGHVGLMRTGTITDGQSEDVRNVNAMRAAGGYAGTMESGTAATFGSASILGLNLDLGQLLNVASVFVPVAKSSSVTGYRKGMKITATGNDIEHGTGNAGGYVALAVGAQIWGDRDENGDELTSSTGTDASIGAAVNDAVGANVRNLRKVSGRNNVGGFVGIAASGSVADVDTDAASGFLSKVLDTVIDSPSSLLQVLQATVVTIRGAHVSPDTPTWGYTVEGAYKDADDNTRYALNAGGFAGSLQAAILGDKDSAKGTGTAVDTANDPAALTVKGLRAVEGGQYAGGFFGLADVSSVASVGGGEAAGDNDGDNNDTNVLLKLVSLGKVGVLEAFRTFIYDGQVTGVSDGIQVKAHVSATSGILDSTRFTGASGGFGGALINGSVKKSGVSNLNSVSGLNYTGGFIGHLGKSGTVSADKAGVADDKLLGLTAGVLDIWGSHIEDSTVTGISAGYTVTSTHNGDDYGKTEPMTSSTKRKGMEIAGGFAGFSDLARISDCTSIGLKKVTSGEMAGGFTGRTSYAYLIDADGNSRLVDALLKYLINPLLKILYVSDAEHLADNVAKWKKQNLGWLTKFIDLDILANGNLIYVNLLGLKIGIGLNKNGTEDDDTDDTAIIEIGDSKIEVACSKDGVDPDAAKNVEVQLIRANRTKIAGSSVQGIADGYDVFGGGAAQDADGVAELKTGYAGGFVGLNDHGLMESDDMTYADTIRGTSGLVGPFSGGLNSDSKWSFNDAYDLEGNSNTYHIYRDVPENWSYALTADKKQFTYGSHMDDSTGDTGGVLQLHLNRYDVAHLANKQNQWGEPVVTPYIQQFSDYKGALVSNNMGGVNDPAENGANKSKYMNVYVSAAKAVLMLDVAVTDNNGGLTPEPDDGQDPCGEDGCQTVDITLQKVWNDRGKVLSRPKSITLQITVTYTDADGNTVTPKEIVCRGESCEPVTQGNPWNVTLDSSDGSLWSETWRKKVSGLPIAFVDGQDENGNDIVRYYTYHVKEIAMTYDGGLFAKDYDKTPTEAGYHVDVSYDNKEYVAKVTNSLMTLPDAGGRGTLWIAAFAATLLGLGAAWYLRESSGSRKRGHHVRA